jgi:hypothetical protein
VVAEIVVLSVTLSVEKCESLLDVGICGKDESTMDCFSSQHPKLRRTGKMHLE